jgi:uncharacterized coiled-coil DUF342 family protein
MNGRGIPSINEERYAVSSIAQNIDALIKKISAQESLTYQEYRHDYHSVMMELTQIWGEFQLLTVDKKFIKGFEKMRKILLLLIDIDKIEKKHQKGSFMFLTTQVSKETRKDLAKYLKGVLKQVKQVQKIVE